MKKALFLITTLLMSTHVLADTYVGIYRVSEDLHINNDINHVDSNAVITFESELKVNDSFGFEGTLFINDSSNLGLLLGVHHNISNLIKLSGGFSMIPTEYSNNISNGLGRGFYVGASIPTYKNLNINIKYINYKDSFTYATLETIENVDDRISYNSKTENFNPTTEQIWVGVTYKF